MHVLDHKGEFLKVRGPLNIARPIQGWPVIVQAGASEAGRQLAAETAEVIFASGSSLVEAQRFYADVKSRAKKAGRSPDHLKILPGALVVGGETIEEAKRKRALLDSLVHPDSGLASLSIALGCDASGFDLDGPLPEIPETNASKSGRERFVSLARRDTLPSANSRRLPAVSADSRLSERRRRSPIRWKNGCSPTAATGSTGCFLMYRAASTTSSTRSSRSWSGEACSGANMRARHCEKILVCRGRRTASSAEQDQRLRLRPSLSLGGPMGARIK